MKVTRGRKAIGQWRAGGVGGPPFVEADGATVDARDRRWQQLFTGICARRVDHHRLNGPREYSATAARLLLMRSAPRAVGGGSLFREFWFPK